jgi:hypothetical protein
MVYFLTTKQHNGDLRGHKQKIFIRFPASWVDVDGS